MVAESVFVANEREFASVRRPDDRAEDVSGSGNELAGILPIRREKPYLLIRPVISNDRDLRTVRRYGACVGVVDKLARDATEKRNAVDAHDARGWVGSVDKKMAAVGEPG